MSEHIRRIGPFRWDGVELRPYKEDGSPFRDVTRQLLFAGGDGLPCELRYFEVAPGGWSSLERHRHVHAVMLIRGRARVLIGDRVVEADTHDLIRVHGARVNNLKDVSVELPKRRLTVFTGVSGSGKSSLVFGTIAAESQRLINETYSAFVQGFMPTLARPEVDVLEGLTTAIIVDQERMGANPRSTVGTATDANAMLRILFSRLGQPHIGPPTAFSFNVPTRKASGVMSTEKAGGRVEKNVVRDVVYLGGMCPRCEGMGSVSDFDLTALYDGSKSLSRTTFRSVLPIPLRLWAGTNRCCTLRSGARPLPP